MRSASSTATATGRTRSSGTTPGTSTAPPSPGRTRRAAGPPAPSSSGLRQLEAIRAQDPCFTPEASVTTWDTHNPHVLSLIRRTGEEALICLFNFSGAPQHVSLDAMEGICTDLITGEETFCAVKDLAPYQYALCRKRPEAE